MFDIVCIVYVCVYVYVCMHIAIYIALYLNLTRVLNLATQQIETDAT